MQRRSRLRRTSWRIKYAPIPEDLPYCSWSNERAPEDIETYTDGSLLNPTIDEYSLAGAGIWETPSRRSKHGEVEVEADNYTTNEEFREGMSRWMMCDAEKNSSGRCELIATVAALFRPGGLHTGLDNLAVCVKANSMILHD